MRLAKTLTVASLALAASCSKAPEPAATAPPKPEIIARMDPGLDALVAPTATVDKVATGFKFVEGPLWKSPNLWFSDLVGNVLYQTTPDGKVTELLNPGGFDGKIPPEGGYLGPNGMAIAADGSVYLCQHGNRRIVRIAPDKKVTVVVDKFEGKKLNSPNDLIFTPDGSLYFTDPPFGLAKGNDDPAKESKFNGVYRWNKGKLTAVVKDVVLPNGIAFSPDYKTMYVSVSDAAHRVWMKYDVAADGSVSNGSVFADASASKDQGVPDGVRVDASGNVFAAGPGGIWIFSPAGKNLGIIKTPEGPSNLAWGDDDNKTLYITATNSVYKVRTLVAGLAPVYH